ncbi:alkyl hydroperoxide reductase [Rhodothalassium salexigens]|uniref:peroxiredoxin n=1 Tax=Rhodothalassium salexigens TaxID=1086 RepID=UPI0019115D26|nr:peroxiredoxin [Rhodothalassium salexigens]MBK5912703.1 alkyl hydroperoxide reductase [Rhodothalassium salexigens]
MLTVGDKLPAFSLKAVYDTSIPEPDFKTLASSSDELAGKWLVLFYWPKDFTFVCPTEIVAFDDLADGFKDRDAVVLGASTDTDFVHRAWRESHEDLQKVTIPWLADNKKELASALGILDKEEGVALRATFLVDPDGIIRHVSVNDLSVGRNPKEVMRILDALQTDELCPCNWQQGDEVLKPAA